MRWNSILPRTRSAGRVGPGAWLALGLATCLAGAPGARAEVLRMESVGAAPVLAEETSQVSKRRAALRQAVHGAVLRVAEGLLAPEAYEIELESPVGPEPGRSPQALEAAAPNFRELLEVRLDAALGDQPFDYAVRYQILEDRGERPALYVDDPEVVAEYVMVAEVYVDSERVRQRLAQAGVPLMPSGEGDLTTIRVVLLDLESFRAFSAVRDTLSSDRRVQSVVPVEMERGRATLEVVVSRSVDQLLETLRQHIPEDVEVQPVAIERDLLTLRVNVTSPDPSGKASLASPGD